LLTSKSYRSKIPFAQSVYKSYSTPFPDDIDGSMAKSTCKSQSNDGIKWCYRRIILTKSGVEKYSLVFEVVGDEFKAEIVDLALLKKKYGFSETGWHQQGFKVRR
jgi:hypothetical protein